MKDKGVQEVQGVLSPLRSESVASRRAQGVQDITLEDIIGAARELRDEENVQISAKDLDQLIGEKRPTFRQFTRCSPLYRKHTLCSPILTPRHHSPARSRPRHRLPDPYHRVRCRTKGNKDSGSSKRTEAGTRRNNALRWLLHALRRHPLCLSCS